MWTRLDGALSSVLSRDIPDRAGTGRLEKSPAGIAARAFFLSCNRPGEYEPSSSRHHRQRSGGMPKGADRWAFGGSSASQGGSYACGDVRCCCQRQKAPPPLLSSAGSSPQQGLVALPRCRLSPHSSNVVGVGLLRAFKRPTISTVTPPGWEGFKNTATVSTRSLIASAASEFERPLL
jgi:hypothetical protein